MRDCLITLYRRPPEVGEGLWRYGEDEIPCLTASNAGAAFLDVTFEQAGEQLERRMKVYAEPDGSFALGGSHRDTRWEVVGMMYDAGPSLAYVEFQGSAPPDVWRPLLNCLIPSEADQHDWNEYMLFVRDAGRFLAIDVFLERYLSDSIS